jgi:hypothetical protein
VRLATALASGARLKSGPTLTPVAICVALLLVSCGGSSPAQPSPQPPPTVPPPPAPSVLTLSGTVTATNGGHPLASVTVEAAAISSTTDSSGRYSLGLPAGTQGSRFTISGPGLLTHVGFFSSGGSRTVDLEAITLGGFDHGYFRAIARNGYEQPAVLQPLRRWTRAPMLYIRTVDDTGRPILPEVLQQVASIASTAVPQYTGGRFGLAGIEQGTDTRKGQAGWLTVEWTRDATEFCGYAFVGQEGSTVTLTYDQPGCSCGSQKIRPRTVKHEFGHALGLWHTGQGVDLMSGIGVAECDRNMTARELQYLDYLYRRPVGNTDPDNDPSSGALLRPIRIIN